MRKKIYLMISLLLCVLMILSALSLTSCESKDNDNNDTETEATEECKSVVRVKRGIASGKKILKENLEVVTVPVADIPEGAIESIDDIEGKYATVNMVLGEYVFSRMFSDEAPALDDNLLTYIVVSDKIENATGKDITAELQKLIDTYPGKTIFFNDGVYTISSTVYIPSDKEKAVSFRLSNYATIKAAEGWKAEAPMISIGAKTEAANAEKAANAFMGGKLDGAGFAKIGLSVENCANPFISNVTFENLKTSIDIKKTADTVNLDAITVKGSGEADSTAILNESSKGVFSTVNIANVNTGVKNSGSDNDFRNISVKCNAASESSVGFYEGGDNNIFEFCTAEDFASGYFIKDGVKSVFEGCNAYWTKADVTVQNGFVAEGNFNSLISASTVRFFDATSANAYIKLTARGSGLVRIPMFNETLCDDQGYKSVLAGTVITIN